jgi:hypothetical protein
MAIAAFMRRAPVTDPETDPSPPPLVNPFEEAIRQFRELRDFAERQAHYARKVAAENRQLLADNDGLGREVDRLLNLSAELAKDNRLIRAYATSVRTRLTVIREAIENADRESLQYAHNEATEPQPELPTEETAELAEVVEGIHRVNGTEPPPNEWGR